jgi:hypothetical protein
MVKIPDQHLTIPPLENGARLNRYEFERRYNAMPNLKKTEWSLSGFVVSGCRVISWEYAARIGSFTRGSAIS